VGGHGEGAKLITIFSTPVILHTYPPMKMEQTHTVPKCRHIKFRHRGITQKKAYNIQNKAKVLNEEERGFVINIRHLLTLYEQNCVRVI